MIEENFKIEKVASLTLLTRIPYDRYIVTSDQGYHGCFWAETIGGKMSLVLGELSDTLEEAYWEQQLSDILEEAEEKDKNVKNPPQSES